MSSGRITLAELEKELITQGIYRMQQATLDGAVLENLELWDGKRMNDPKYLHESQQSVQIAN